MNLGQQNKAIMRKLSIGWMQLKNESSKFGLSTGTPTWTAAYSSASTSALRFYVLP